MSPCLQKLASSSDRHGTWPVPDRNLAVLESSSYLTRIKAPKSGPSQAEKLNRIIKYLRESRTCHTLKELEKSLPSIASINGMAVKDFIKNLTDEDRIHVEKIGSGNWYWCWGDETGKKKTEIVSQLE